MSITNAMVFVKEMIKSLVMYVRSWKAESITSDERKVSTGENAMEISRLNMIYDLHGCTKASQHYRFCLP